MAKRYVSIWFRHLLTDWIVRCNPALKDVAFVLKSTERGRMVVTAANPSAESKGIYKGMVVADCKAILPELEAYDEPVGQNEKLLHALAEWCIRYTPIVAIDLPDGLILDVTGCPHLWGGERNYLKDIITRLRSLGYDIRIAIADTIGAALAVSHYSQSTPLIETGKQLEALLPLPVAALRIEQGIVGQLDKLGLHTIDSIIKMPRRALRRRFGQVLLTRIDQALGQELETIEPVIPIEPYMERLPSLEPIRTAKGIEIALKRLLEQLCKRLELEELGLRICTFKCYSIDGNLQQTQINTTRPSRSIEHLFKLFEIKIPLIEPGLGFELFTLDATKVEALSASQEALWSASNHNETVLAELLDRVAGKVGMNTIHRYLPDEHYWPERSIKLATSLLEKPTTVWREEVPRPVHLLSNPEPIEVTVPIPDYPPMLFRYKGELHNVSKADGPERIEQEWWIEKGLYRDYYCVEDEKGARYWLFRLGHYNDGEPKWFIHGFFA